MPNPTSGTKIIQVQVPNELAEKLEEISNRTHVPRTAIIKMGVELVVAQIMSGQIPLGIAFSPPSYAQPGQPAQAQPAFQVVADPRLQNK